MSYQYWLFPIPYFVFMIMMMYIFMPFVSYWYYLLLPAPIEEQLTPVCMTSYCGQAFVIINVFIFFVKQFAT